MKPQHFGPPNIVVWIKYAKSKRFKQVIKIIFLKKIIRNQKTGPEIDYSIFHLRLCGKEFGDKLETELLL